MATSFRKPIWSSVGGATQSETSKIIVRLWSYCSSPLRRASLRPRRRAAEPTAAAPTAAGRAAAASQQPRSCLPTLACLACIISSASARPAQIPSICPPRHLFSSQPQLRLRASAASRSGQHPANICFGSASAQPCVRRGISLGVCSALQPLPPQPRVQTSPGLSSPLRSAPGCARVGARGASPAAAISVGLHAL